MMEKLKSLFEQYKKNYTEWAICEQNLLQNLSEEEWMNQFRASLLSQNEMYQFNKDFMEQIEQMFKKGITEHEADVLYDCSMDMYYNDYNDVGFLYFLFGHLFDFYEKKEDHERMILLNSGKLYCQMEINNPEAFGPEFDTSLVLKGLQYLQYFKEVSDNARARLIICFYTYTCRLVDYGIISVEASLKVFHEICDFFARDDIKKIIESSEQLKDLRAFLINSYVIDIVEVIDESKEVWESYLLYVKQFFQDNYPNRKSTYEFSPEEYACYLFRECMEDRCNFEDAFDQYLDYFVFRFHKAKSQASLETDDLLSCINAIRFITKIGNRLKDPVRLGRAVDSLIEFLQTRWIRGNKTDTDKINEMLCKACLCLLSFDCTNIDKEKYIKQLIIQRNINTYVQSSLTAEISIAIYTEAIEKHPEFLGKIKSIPALEWRTYLYYAALFHDMGNAYPVGVTLPKNRPLFDFEEEIEKLHPFYGKKALENMVGMEKYIPVVYGHHVFYKTEGGFPKDYNVRKLDIFPIVQIISLASEIEKCTNPYWDFDRKAVSFKYYKNLLEMKKDQAFSQELIDIVLSSTRLQKEITEIVTVRRNQYLYDLHKDWVNIQLTENDESVVDEIEKRLYEYYNNRDEQAFLPYVDRLNRLIEHTKDVFLKGRALYLKMRFYSLQGDYLNTMMIEDEVNYYLETSKNYQLLIKSYSGNGIAELIRENKEMALNKFLYALDIARSYPECEMEKNSVLINIATIYSTIGYHQKAIEYYEEAANGQVEDFEMVRISCMAGYSYLCIGNQEKVKKYNEVLLKGIENSTLELSFPIYVYLAVFHDFLKEDQKRDEFLKILENIVMPESEIEYSLDEVKIYINLLYSLEKYETLMKVLEHYIDFSKNKDHMAKFYVFLLRKKMVTIAITRGETEIVSTEKNIEESEKKAMLKDGERMEEMEKKFLHAIHVEKEKEEFKKNQEYLKESAEQAKSASEQKSQFLSSMSHEIRTPINAILGLNEMILRESNEDDILQYATDIHNAGKQLLGIVNDVLDYSKIEAGKMEITPQKYVLGELLNDIKNMMEPKFSEKRLGFFIRCNNDIPNVLYGDDLRIKQILLNLLSNAYKYTKEGYVTFKIDYEIHDEKSIDVSFAVKDTGIGLKPEQIEKLSIPFERFELSQNRNVEGTGLGMSIVTKLLEHMDAKLEIVSEFGKGSTFSFKIRQEVLEWNQIGHLDQIRKRVFDKALLEKKAKKYVLEAPNAKVLVVDDNAVNLKVMSALLKRTKMKVTLASSGEECLKLCKENGYHIIFLDHMMPEMDGIETLHKLIEMKGINENTPKIALTANVMDSADDFYRKAGFHALLTKPVNVDELEQYLREFLPDYLKEG